MSTHSKSIPIALLIALFVTSMGALLTVGNATEANAQPAITVGQLAGPWNIVLAGNTGCGASSMHFSGNLNASGIATGDLTGSSAQCGESSSAQTFTITSLNSHGSGTANLSCGSVCGWNFNIQVAPNEQTFSLVDVVNTGNVLAGTAVAETGSGITIDQMAGPWQIALIGNTGCGTSSMVFTATMNASGIATGTLSGSGTQCFPSSSTQTFAITGLNSNGFGTARLSCGSGCGWNFLIQVSADKQMFNLVDFVDGNANVLAGIGVSQVGSGITVDQLAGPWQIALVGNTGCGQSAMQFGGTMNFTGTATGTLSGSSTGCASSSSTQTLTIDSLNPDGSGTATLSCGSNCGWTFDIQLAPSTRTFNLVDVVNVGNELAGTAVAESGFVIVPDLLGETLQEATADVQALGLHLRAFGSGDVVSQKPGPGTGVPLGSTVTVHLLNQ
jgi:PASTA domain